MGVVDDIEWAEQRISIQFYIKLEHSSAETIWKIQKAVAMGNWWLAALSQHHTRSCIMSCAEFFCETSNHSGDSAPLQPRFGVLWLLAFLKTKTTFERKEISDHHRWDQENMTGQLMAIGRTVWGPEVSTLKATEVLLSCIQCFLYLVSSINVSFFSHHMVGYILNRPLML